MPNKNLNPTSDNRQPDSQAAISSSVNYEKTGAMRSPAIIESPKPIVSKAINNSNALESSEDFQPDPAMSSAQYEENSDQDPLKKRQYFITLGILQVLGVALIISIMASAIQQSKAGVSGTEFTGLIVFATLVPAVGLIALVNLFRLPVYIRRYKPHGKTLLLSLISLLISIMLVLYGLYIFYYLILGVIEANKHELQFYQEYQKQQQQFIAENANPEITKDEAIALLYACQLKGFYYTNQTSPKEDGNWAEFSTTGVVLTNIDGKPYRISIADRLVPELVPIARQAQKICDGQPQFWHDGRYEF